MGNKDYIKEKSLNNHAKSTNLEGMETITQQMKQSVCKIICKDGNSGTGFFCLFQNPENLNEIHRVLITNNHVLDEKDIKPGKKINLVLNNNLKLQILLDESRRTLTNEEYDFTIIEIKNNDGIELNSFLEIDEQIYEEKLNDIYKNKQIYLLHYPNGTEIKKSEELVKFIDEKNYEIEHYCDSSHGSSGGPLINSNNFKVMGIHKGASKENWNLGIILKISIDYFFRNNKDKGNKNDSKKNFKEINNKENKSYNILLIGKAGAGISSLGNLILGENAFEIGNGYETITKISKIKVSEKDPEIAVIDTIGIDEGNPEKFDYEIRSIIKKVENIHFILFISNSAFCRFTYIEKKAIEKLCTLFPYNLSEHFGIVFNHYHYLDPIEEVKENVKSIIEEIHKLIKNEITSESNIFFLNSRYIIKDNEIIQKDKWSFEEINRIKSIVKTKSSLKINI